MAKSHQRILSLLLALTLLAALLPAALAEDADVFDNSDLGPDYADSTIYLGCDEWTEDDVTLKLDVDLDALVGVDAGSVFKYLGKFAGKEIGGFLMDKALDKIWGLAFGDETAEKLDKILAQLAEINGKLDKIIEKIDNVERQKYMNERLKMRINLNTEIQDTMNTLKTIDAQFNAKTINQKQRYAKRVAALRKWDTKKINGSDSGFTAAISYARYAMQMKANGRNYFGIIDDFAYSKFPFEHMGYEMREQERAAEMTCYGYAAALSAMALQLRDAVAPEDRAQQTENQKLLAQVTEEYGKFFEKNKITFHKDSVVFQIKGLQKFVLSRTQLDCWYSPTFEFGKTSRYNLDNNFYKSMRTQFIRGWVFQRVMEFYGKKLSAFEVARSMMGLPIEYSNNNLVTSSEWEVYYKGRYKAELCGRGYWLEDKDAGESLWIYGIVNLSGYRRGKAADNPHTKSWDKQPYTNLTFQLYTMKQGEFVPVEELAEQSAEAEPEARHLSGTVMHVDEDDGTLYVLGDLVANGGETSTVAYELDISALDGEWPPVNGMSVEADFILNPDNGEDKAQFTASALTLPEPETLSGKVSLTEASALSVLGEDGAEHAFALPDTLTLAATPEEGMDITVTYVPVTPVVDWLAEDYDGDDNAEGLMPDADAPAEYVLSVTLGDEAMGDTLDGTVSAMAGKYMTVLDNEGAEHAFTLTEETQIDEGVEEGVQVRVSYHATDEKAAAEGDAPVADSVALMISPVDPEKDAEEMNGVIESSEGDTLRVLCDDDGLLYDFDISDAQVEGDLAQGSRVYIAYHTAATGLEAETVTCLDPEDDASDSGDNNDSDSGDQAAE